MSVCGVGYESFTGEMGLTEDEVRDVMMEGSQREEGRKEGRKTGERGVKAT